MVTPPYQEAEQAFSAYQTILSQARANKTLLDSEEWNARRMAAYDEFVTAFEAMK